MAQSAFASQSSFAPLDHVRDNKQPVEVMDSAVQANERKYSSTLTSSSIWKRHLMANIRPSLLAEIELIMLTFFTGMQDAVSFPDYHCFTSNQTGNTVFLSLAIVFPSDNGTMFETANIGVALGFFLLASCITGQLGHFIGPRRRLWLMLCNFLQALLVLAAGALRATHAGLLPEAIELTIIGLLAFAAGSQVVQSRSMSMTEISTAMATAAWVDLVIDPQLLKRSNRPRTRRVIFLSTLFLGSLVGAVIYRFSGSAVVILISGGGKIFVAMLYLFNEADETLKEEMIEMEQGSSAFNRI